MSLQARGSIGGVRRATVDTQVQNMKRLTGLTGITVWLVVYGLSCMLRGEEQLKYYDITGSSATQLRESLDRQRPVGPDGMPHDAVTLWNIRWQYRTPTSADTCAVISFETSLEVVTILPRWTNEKDAESSLVARWRDYYAKLLDHENGHKAIATATAAALRDAGTKAPSHSSCVELARSIDSVGTAILEESRQKQRQYDTETEHGRTQGARFP
jgi:predicted secreted Zn-dependent protease